MKKYKVVVRLGYQEKVDYFNNYDWAEAYALSITQGYYCIWEWDQEEQAYTQIV